MTSIYIGAMSHRFQGQIEAAEKCIELVLNSVSQIPQFELVCYYELGTTAIKYSNWNKAIQCLSHYYTSMSDFIPCFVLRLCDFLDNKSEMVRCICAYELGVAYCFENEEEKARECFRNCIKWVFVNLFILG
jgi:hypothetical protein